jgi:hypothetical protein
MSEKIGIYGHYQQRSNHYRDYHHRPNYLIFIRRNNYMKIITNNSTDLSILKPIPLEWETLRRKVASQAGRHAAFTMKSLPAIFEF